MRIYNNKIKAPKYYSLKTTCHIHGWKNLAPFSWDEDRRCLAFAVLAEEAAVEITVKQENDYISLVAVSHAALNARQKDSVNTAVIRALDLATETTELYKLSKSIKSEYGVMVKNGAGRMLRSPSLWEDAAKTLFTTNCTWGLTQIMCNSACSSIFSLATPKGVYPFPDVDKVARTTVNKLKDKMRVGYRADYLKNLALNLKHDRQSLHIEAYSEDELRSYFGSLKGFGAYATNHMLVLCGFYTQIPVDTVVKAYVKEQHHTDDCADFIEMFYDKWGEYRWWGMRLEQIANNSNWLGD